MSTNHPVLAWGSASDVGLVRESNEDNYVAQPLVFAVADGMGGHQAGEVASAIASSVLGERLGNGALSTDLVVAAINEANAAIFHGAHSNSSQRGMGTTLTALVVMTTPEGHQHFVVANVGDSRTYLMRDGSLRRVTIDHSYVQELVSTGHITEAEARNHPRRNIVTRALGIEPTVRVDTEVLPIVRGDRFVLCSDGLVDEASDDDIANLIIANANPQACAQALIELANSMGGRDNTTVVVVDVLAGTANQAANHAAESDAVLEPVTDPSGEVPVPMQVAADPEAIPVAAPQRSGRFPRLTIGLVVAAVALAAAIVISVVAGGGSSPAPTTSTTSTAPASTTSTSTTTSTTVATSGT